MSLKLIALQSSSLAAVRPREYVRIVPRISAFYGIVIAMYFDDHPPPHFHAKYGEHQAQIDIATGEVLHGELPRVCSQPCQGVD